MSEIPLMPVALFSDASDDGRRLQAVVEWAAEELARRWRHGERPRVEEYFDRIPDWSDCPEAALELIAEEMALRQEHGEPASAVELSERFPAWRDQIDALFKCHRAFALHPFRLGFPHVGDTLGEFRLLAELGRGTNGRVFLATQPSLAGRCVVLKLSPDSGREHVSLGRLQHTHIVPLYSIHEFPERGLRGLCLPYFGGATLAALLEAVHEIPTNRRTGRHLIDALTRMQSAAPVSIRVEGPACRFLAQASYIQAVCWIGSCLADALQYAHDHGLIHLDLKPSNVLIAADGQPMLLDFHLARGPLTAGSAAPLSFGGTSGYMAPEQRAALDAVRAGRAIPKPLDGRSDVFTLGLLLCEILGIPGERCSAASSVDRRITPGLEAVLRRCTALDLAARYTAGELAADLRRHLANLPLRGVANRSLAERWRKWRRRQPHALPLLCLLIAGIAAGVSGLANAHRLTDRARSALHDAESQLRDGRYVEAIESANYGEVLADGLSFRRELIANMHAVRHAAEHGRALQDLHQFCEAIRPLYDFDSLSIEQLQPVVMRCRQLWERRESLAGEIASASTELERQARVDLYDFAVLLAQLETRLAEDDRSGHERALEILSQAEALLQGGTALFEERALHARALGLLDVAEEALRRSSEVPPRTAFEHLAVGRARLHAGDLQVAAQHLDCAIDLEPQSLWPNFYKGVCSFRQSQPAEAAAAFSACVALAPRSGWCYYNRGLAYVKLHRSEQAERDFERALALDPTLTPASNALATLRRHANLSLPTNR